MNLFFKSAENTEKFDLSFCNRNKDRVTTLPIGLTLSFATAQQNLAYMFTRGALCGPATTLNGNFSANVSL